MLDPAQTPEGELEQAIEEVIATGLYTRDQLDRMLSGIRAYHGYRVIIEVPEGGSVASWDAFIAGD